jgi:superfamily II DNA/RNA helicase
VEPLHPTEDVPDIENFRHWELREEIFEALDADNIVKPTPIQAIAISHVLAGKDVIARAQTGTGKTLAFAAPMLTRLDPTRSSVLALILSPTRELAEQIAKVFAALGEKIGLKVALIVGGEPAQPQVAALQAGAQIVVGTPGRVLDLYGQKFLSFPWTEIVVLDEADEMLEIGFIDDIKEILSKTPDERQTLLFSATFPTQLLKLARDYTRDPVEMATVSGHATADTVKQSWFKVDREEERPMAILRMLEQSEPEDVFLVFCDRRVEVERLFRKLERSSFSIKALHGGYEQEARFRVMDAFRGKEVKALIATDVASRGLDVKHVTHVINCGAPRNITGYTHRVGRTGRAGREGKAISIIAPPNMRNWKPILDQATWPIEEVSAPERTRQGGGGGGRDRGSRSNQGARSSRDNQRSRDGRGDREERGRDADRGNRDDRRARGGSGRGGGGEGQSGESRGGGRRRERSSEGGDSRPGEQRTEQKSGDTPRDERPRRRRERSEDGGSGRPSDGERGSRRSRSERSESEQSKSDGGRERAQRPSKRPTAPPAAPGGFGDGV